MLQLVNHGIPTELLERVKEVCSECYKLEREPNFKDSEPVRLLNELIESGETEKKLDDLDWEDVFHLQDNNQWPSNPPEFKYKPDTKNSIFLVRTEFLDSQIHLELVGKP